jgi:chromosome segregation ATPase
MTPSDTGSSPADVAAPRTAAILAFPVRAKPDPAAAQARLGRAMRSLNAALSDQKVAIATWRLALNDLKSSSNGLQDSLHRYRQTLNSLDGRLATLRAEAGKLERWADGGVAE